MSNKPNNLAEQNLIFAGLGLQLGILSKDKVIRAFTEWLFDKSKPLSDILIQQKAITAEEANSLKVAVQAHIQKEGDQEKALASLHMVKDLESDLNHLVDIDLQQTLDVAVTKRKDLGLDHLFTQTYGSESGHSEGFTFGGPASHSKDRFERQKFLDAGNLGEVYFAKDTELNRLVVAKYIKPERSGESLTQALFHLEGEVTGALEHPNIVPVYGLGKDTKGRLYYAMRYIRGRKLTRVIAEYHQIPKSESSKKHEALIGLLQYFQSACLAIEYAHSKGVLHCDIKPDNIMIGDYGEVFVVDWGLVVVQGEAKGSNDPFQMDNLELGVMTPYKPSELASSGLHEQQGGSRKGVGGTPAYMAPEQFKATMEGNISLVTAKTDIYALGSTLYHLLTGRAPHLPKSQSKESPDAFFFRITTGMIPKPKEIKPNVSKSLEGIVLKAMEVKPEDRYTSARELAEDIKRWVADEPVSAYQENVVEKGLRFARNNKALLIAASLVLVFVAVAGFMFSVITNRHNENLAKTNDLLSVSEKTARSKEAEANIEREKAKASEKIATQQKDFADQQLYVNKIQRANTEWLNGDAQVARDLLLTIPFDQREWEHHYLNSSMNSNHFSMEGHSGTVTGVDFCPNSTKIASCCKNGRIIIWDTKTGEKILNFKGSSKRLNCVSFSPDGSEILSAGMEIEAPLKIWDSNSGKELLRLERNKSQFYSAIFSPDRKIIICGDTGGFIRKFDLKNGNEIQTFKAHEKIIRSISLSPDSKKIASSSDDQTIKVWDAISGAELLTINNLGTGIRGLSYSPDGKKIAGGGGGISGSLKIWDSNTGKELISLGGHKSNIFSVEFSPDGKSLASASEDKTIKIWDTETGKEIQTLKGHGKRVEVVKFSPDGKKILSGSEDGTIRIWNLSPNQTLPTFKRHGGGTFSLKFNPDSSKLITGSGNKLIIWDVLTGKEILTLNGHEKTVHGISISLDGKRIASGSEDGTIKLWDASNGQNLLTFKAHLGTVNTVSFSPDGSKIASGSNDTTINLWDASNGQNLHTLKGHLGTVNTVSFSPDGSKIVSGGGGHYIRIWDSVNARELIGIKASSNYITNVSFSPDGSKIVSGGFDKDNPLKVWDTKSGKEILNLRENKAQVHAVSFSPNGNRIVSASADKFIRLFDVKTGQKLFSYELGLSAPRCVAISPDGKMIGTGADRANSLEVLKATLGFEKFILGGHGTEVRSVSLDADGKKIISAGSDNTIKIWDRASGQVIKTFDEMPWQIRCVAFGSDGKRLIMEDQKQIIHALESDSGKEVFPTKSEVAEYKMRLNSNSTNNNEWSVETEYGNVILVNNKLREERIAWDKERLASWSQPDPNWHSQNAEESENNNQWFAAAFHLRKLLEIEPKNEAAKKRLKAAEDNLKQSK